MLFLKHILRTFANEHTPSCLTLSSPAFTQIRTATKKAGAHVRNTGGTAGKRLGLKRTGGQYVERGDILIRQRGTKWHPGQHVGIGRDHTLYALEPGWLKFYRVKRPNPSSSRNRVWTYCGIALKQDDPVPRPEEELGRSRRFPFVELNRFKEVYHLGKIDNEPSQTKPFVYHSGNTYRIPKTSGLSSPLDA